MLLQVFTEALIFSNLFKCRKLRRGQVDINYNLKRKVDNKCKYPFVSTIRLDIQYFGIPIFFSRLSFTSAVNSIPIAFVRWVKFECESSSNNNNCCIGHIPMAEWQESNSLSPSEHDKILAPFISFNDLLPSRFALSYIAPDNIHAYNVKCAFLGLDSHQLGEDVNDNFHHDFGDNIFPYYRGNTSTDLKYYSDGAEGNDDDFEENLIPYLNEEDFDRVAKYIPDTVLRYLTT